ncbi:MAG: dethiobiotin synthase [Colwellia sp.]|nr:dethiobiotin synthase [Colwellia sp.]
MKKIFITATDTDAGKTFVACALTQALINVGKKVAVYKPIAAGCQQVGDLLVNEDAQLLSQFSNCKQSISEVNPITLAAAIAPHIAASNENRAISIEEISQGFSKVTSLKAEVVITEGAGGWRLPIYINNNIGKSAKKHILLSDFAQDTKQDVILVINMKLGCLNHALLTYQAIIADGLQCIAWIANTASDQVMPYLNENIASLEQLLPMPKIAQLDFYNEKSMSLNDKINAAANKIDITHLL